MTLAVDQLEVTSFETVSYEPAQLSPYTPPIPDCYSPYCVPTDLPDQCPPETTIQTAAD
jgi:hypothetical protein